MNYDSLPKDIVERLRGGVFGLARIPLCHEAAGVIEELRNTEERWQWCVKHKRFPSMTRPVTSASIPHWTCATADGLMQYEGTTPEEAVSRAMGNSA